jgi:hypothetical protein
MKLIYLVEKAYPGPKDVRPVILTTELGVALETARKLKPEVTGPDSLGSVWVTAWVAGEHNFCYVDLESGRLFDYDDRGHPFWVLGDFSFGAHPPEGRAKPGPEAWVEEGDYDS